MLFLKTNIDPPLTHISNGRFMSAEPWMHIKRNIDSFVLIIGLQGTVFIQQGDEQYEVNPGQVLLLIPHTTHFGYKMSQETVSYYWSHFYCKSPYEVLDRQDFTEDLLLMGNSRNTANDSGNMIIPVFFTCKHMDRINLFINQMLHMSSSNYFTKYGVDYLLTVLMIELAEQIVSEYIEDLKKKDKSSRFIEVTEWIRINLNKDFSTSDVAKKFNYNPDYLSRIFRHKTGMNLQQYIHSLKIAKAKELLLHSRSSIKEIAYMTGFKDEKYFMKLFKSYENITPSKFRNAFSNTHMNNH